MLKFSKRRMLCSKALESFSEACRLSTVYVERLLSSLLEKNVPNPAFAVFNQMPGYHESKKLRLPLLGR
jgi:hypothetical protein